MTLSGDSRVHVLSADLVRSSMEVSWEVVTAYASLLSVPVESLVLHNANMGQQFAAIRDQFSLARFQADARRDAEGFVSPGEVCSRVLAAYAAAGFSLEVLVRQMQVGASRDRFNESRCAAVFQGDPEYD